MSRDLRRRPGIWDDFQGFAPDLETARRCPGIWPAVPGGKATSGDLRRLSQIYGAVAPLHPLLHSPRASAFPNQVSSIALISSLPSRTSSRWSSLSPDPAR